MRRGILIAAVTILGPFAGVVVGDAPLSEEITAIVGQYERGGAEVGLSVVALPDGEALCARRADERFAPASNAKLLTSAFALVSLGADFEYVTAVYVVGDDVVVYGTGDPTLGDPELARRRGQSIYAELDRWAAAVRKARGGRPVRNVLVTGSTDASVYRHVDWPDNQHHRWYAAPVAGLNFHNNCIDVTFNLANGRPDAVVTPSSRLLRIIEDLRPGKRHLWGARFGEGDAVVRIRGTIRCATDEPMSVAVNDPPMFLGRTFADRLIRKGVQVDGQVATIAPAELDFDAATCAAATTTPVARALARCNKDSLNMAAECLLLRAGDGTWSGSAATARRTLAETFGVPPGSMTVRDGSGLSRRNRVTPRTMTAILAGMLARPEGDVFRESLAVSGVDGTLDDRLDEAGRRRVLGKSGYIAGVSALSGYVLDESARPRAAFSILVRNLPAGKNWLAKQMQERVARAIIGHVDAPAATAPAATPSE